jgi:hypothetical protein
MRSIAAHICLIPCFLLLGCATPTDVGMTPSPTTQGIQTQSKSEAEVVTGSRIPVRGTQPVRTIDEEEIMRDTRVIGVPTKGN